jgi:hypothetical protein
MFRGQITGIVPGDTGRDEIGLMMAGADPSGSSGGDGGGSDAGSRDGRGDGSGDGASGDGAATP